MTLVRHVNGKNLLQSLSPAAQSLDAAKSSEKLENSIRQRIEEWTDHLNDARYFGDSHYVQRCNCVLTLLKNILAEA